MRKETFCEKTNSGGIGDDDQQAISWQEEMLLWKAIYWLAANTTCLAGDLLHNNGCNNTQVMYSAILCASSLLLSLI